MSIEFVRVQTEDSLYLDGALHLPAGAINNEAAVDVFVLFHGTGSNFYASGILEAFTSNAVEAGIPVLRVNSRGHDLVASISSDSGTLRGGAAYEVISECRNDVRAWVSLLQERGFRNIVAVGHSMGSVKLLYTLAHDTQLRITRAIAISPPRFCHANLINDPRCDAFRSDYARACQLVETGNGDTLIDVRQPLPLTLMADSFIAKYGPHDDYDFVKHLPNVPIPVLFIIGSRTIQSSPSFSCLDESIRDSNRGLRSVSVEIVDGAHMNYANDPNRPFKIAIEWLEHD